jgi:mono/diheme cytochrome c family protein
MKTISGRHALLAALVVSGTAVVTTLGTALAMRPSQLSNLLGSKHSVIMSRDMSENTRILGRRLFLMNCAKCHGRDARGFDAPDLNDLNMGDVLIHQVITDGVKDEMPSYANKLTETEIRALIVYLRTLRSRG